MAKLTFTYTDTELENREASQIEFTVPDDMDINEYKVMCMRLASAMGYHHETIVKGFGNEVYNEEITDGFKKLLNEIRNENID